MADCGMYLSTMSVVCEVITQNQILSNHLVVVLWLLLGYGKGH